MGPNIYYVIPKGKWFVEYGMIPKYREEFDTEEEARDLAKKIFPRHMELCEVFAIAQRLIMSECYAK